MSLNQDNRFMGTQPHSYIVHELAQDIPGWLGEAEAIGREHRDEWELLGRSVRIPRGEIDILCGNRIRSRVLVVEVKCLYNCDKSNQQLQGLDKAIGQTARYMFGLRSSYFGYKDKIISGLVICTFKPYKNPDMSQWGEDIELWHPGNSKTAQKLRHLLDLWVYEQEQYVVPETMPDNLIHQFNERIDKTRALIDTSVEWDITI